MKENEEIKIKLAVEENGIPIAITIARANQHYTQLFIPILNNLPKQINQSKNHFIHTDKGFISKNNRKEAINNNYTPIMADKKPKNKHYSNLPIKDLKRWVLKEYFHE
ncbi:MAG: transposase [Candidatus Chromulinivorax sp.]